MQLFPPTHPHTAQPWQENLPPPRAEPPGGLTGWGREAAPRPAALPSCLAHQLVPRDGAEEGVGLELGDAAATSAQTPLGVVLQELQGKRQKGSWESCPGWASASLWPCPPSQAPHLGEQRRGRQAEPLWQVQLGVRVNPRRVALGQRLQVAEGDGEQRH